MEHKKTTASATAITEHVAAQQTDIDRFFQTPHPFSRYYLGRAKDAS